MVTVNGFGERLLALREERKETQADLANAIGITRQSLSRYETNERTPNIDLIYNIAKHYNISTDYLLGLSQTKSLNDNDKIRAACEVTGLSENAIKMLSQLKNADHNKNPDRQNRFICPRIKIADYLISGFQFWSYCYDVSCTLNYKRLSEKTIEEINENMNRHISEQKRLYSCYSEDEDISVCDYNRDIEDEKEWLEFKKWELFKHLERISNEIIDNYEDFIKKEE